MSQSVDVRKLAAAVRKKRGERGLRAAAVEVGGVSAATLSRIEQGNLPDLETFVALCRWLGTSPDEFLPTDASMRPAAAGTKADTPAIIAAHLRADRTLSPKTAEALSVMVKLAYAAAARGDLQKRGKR